MESKQKAQLAVALPIVLILGIPAPAFLSIIAGVVITAGIAFPLQFFLKYQLNQDTLRMMRIVIGGLFFLGLYIYSAWRVIDAIKEGEGVLSALYLALFEPIFELLKAHSGRK